MMLVLFVSCAGHGLDDSRKFGWETPEKGEYNSPCNANVHLVFIL